MKKIPIGVVIKEIITEKKLSAVDIASNLGVSRQAIYNAFSREKMNLEEQANWAKALNVDISEFDKRMSLNAETTKSDDYLIRYLESLERENGRLWAIIETAGLGKSEAGISSQKARPFFRVLCANLGARVFTAS